MPPSAVTLPTADISNKEGQACGGARPGHRLQQWRSVPNMLFVTSPAFNSSMPLLFRSVFNFNPHLMQLDVPLLLTRTVLLSFGGLVTAP